MAPQPPPKKILFVPLRFIGDTILSVPMIRNLRYAFPDAEIDVLTSAAGASLLEPCPYINRVITEPRSSLHLLKFLKKQHYDWAFILRKSVTTIALAKLAGIRQVVGYDKQRWMKPIHYKRWGILLDKKAVYPSLRTETPQAISHLNLLHTCNVPVQDDYLELWATDADRNHLADILQELRVEFSKPTAIIHTVSASLGKTFTIEKFVEAVKTLYTNGYQIICTGTENDIPRYNSLKALTGIPIVNLAGKTSLRETFALYQMAQLILTVDSSPIHLAAAAGIPKIVGIFGPTNEKQWGPHRHQKGQSQFWPVFLDLPCRPCYAKICEHNSCRIQLTEDHITQGVLNAIYIR
jgi:ADP-heptose:LPS heptosyltransferase